MNKIWLVLAGCTAALVLAACGDNIKPGTGTDGGDGSVCGDGMVTGSEQCETGDCCQNCRFIVFGTECRAATGECDAAEQCSGLAAECPADAPKPDGTMCGNDGFCRGGDCATCDTAIDADFDGSNQCADCDDNNGAAEPRANELACDGVDDDCDGQIDEDWDTDGDGYSTCSDDPLIRDCDDSQATTHPGAPELCGGGANTGNGRDDNCNGYADEGCMPCTMTDADGDGVTDCMGDCDDTNANMTPGKAETCDGFDTDCNTYTVKNCDVSDQCNFTGDADICMDDLVCGCVLDANGDCTGDYRCISYCQSSYTGPIGAGCTEPTQACSLRWLDSDNQHGCMETTATLGTKLGGETCASNDECRSGSCVDFREFTDDPVDMRCSDFCDHHAAAGGPGSCAAGTVCETVSSVVAGMEFMFATCGLPDGTRTAGQSCDATTNICLWGPDACVNGVCAPPCGEEAHCAAGQHCSLRGNRVTTGVYDASAGAGLAGATATETVPVCLADSAGPHDRPGGAACTDNGQCASQFCEATLNVCVELCVTDMTCAVGMTCEPVYLKAKPANEVVWGRACVNASFGEVLQSK